MMIRLLLFASFAENAGFTERSLELPDGATVGDAWTELLRLAPALSTWKRPPLMALNQRYARVESQLAPGDELAFLPPIAGG